jgi:hypothetical protein
MKRRYEHASTVLTSNKGFEEWGDIFGDDVMAAALIESPRPSLPLGDDSGQQLPHAPAQRTLAEAACAARARAQRPTPPGSSGGADELRLVPSSICQIFNRRNCQMLARR